MPRNPYAASLPNEHEIQQKDLAWIVAFVLFVLSSCCVAHYATQFESDGVNSFFSISSVVFAPVVIPWFPLLRKRGIGTTGRWIIVSLSTLVGATFLFSYIKPLLFAANVFEANYARNSLFGPYWWAIWPRFAFCSVIPILLIFKRCSSNGILRKLIAILTIVGYLVSYGIETLLI